MRTAGLCLVGVLVAGLEGCGLGTSAGQGGLRSFYLTKTTVQGDRALGACTRGYHMASRFEILDVSMLRYQSSIGLTADDSGAGPPSAAAAYGSAGFAGWVRTGGTSRFTDSGSGHGSASTNCAAWSTSSAEARGTVAYLNDKFTSGDDAAAVVWNGGSERCDTPQHVWCVQDYGAPREPTEGPMRRGRHPAEGSEPELRP